MYQGFSQGTVLGPRLLDLYVNDIQKTVTANCLLIQYADDTMLFRSYSDEKQTIEKLNTNVENVDELLRLTTINTDKTDLFIANGTTTQKLKTSDYWSKIKTSKTSKL